MNNISIRNFYKNVLFGKGKSITANFEKQHEELSRFCRVTLDFRNGCFKVWFETEYLELYCTFQVSNGSKALINFIRVRQTMIKKYTETFLQYFKFVS